MNWRRAYVGSVKRKLRCVLVVVLWLFELTKIIPDCEGVLAGICL